MHNNAHWGDAETERQEPAQPLHRLSWDDLRIFLSCVETGSFRRAAEKLNVSSSTIVRRVQRLERALDVRLFNRLPEGVVATEEGRAIVESARRMERAIYDVCRKSTSPEEATRGLVKISVTEGLGSYWVLPRLIEFQRGHPYLTIDLRCAMENADVLRMEADMAIQFDRPVSPDLKMVKLGRMHIYSFVSRSYADRYGVPTSLEDLQNHRLVDQVAPQLEEGAWATRLGLNSIEGIVGVRTNASSALLYAVEKGAGIGALPSYAMALNAPVIPVDLGLRHHMDIWLAYHPDARKATRNSLVIDWVKSIFDPKRFPWFRDDFIHPSELASMIQADAELNDAFGYSAVTPFKMSQAN
jgi:DNA-binding transcriptional LysR family regulator